MDAKVLSLTQAVWVILGANIGTTVTSQVTALDVGWLAPLLAFGGAATLLFSSSENAKRWGGVCSSLGVLFIGLENMGEAVLPLSGESWFLDLLAACKNPGTGILAGMTATALMQSSSASVGILQALSKSGLMDIRQAVYLVYGQNMGTCVTALLASAGSSRSARRAAVIHLLTNVLGTALFVFLSQALPLCEFLAWLCPRNLPRQIAAIHTIFNVVTALALLPFDEALVRCSHFLVPGRGENRKGGGKEAEREPEKKL